MVFENLVDIIIHLDQYLGSLVQQYGIWVYVILFLIIFIETGIVIAPFLPGDSLLFAAGAVAALGALDVALLFALLSVAAIVGDTVNYWIGHFVGPRVFTKGEGRFFKREYLERAQKFYNKHGGKTIVIARFIPIIRTFAPFVAGIGAMQYRRFLAYNIAGGIAWVAIFTFLGFYFGSLQFVRQNFSLVIAAIIVISLIPVAVEYMRHRQKSR